MKIAITTSGTDLDGPIDPRFGRAAGFILYDTESGDWSHHDNSQNLNAAQGAGIQAGQNVVDLGAGAVLTGHCGPKAFRVLAAAGVPVVVGARGTVRQALAEYRAGRLQPTDTADVEGHWA
jgi:predicted Fe-Mo cluster-binding NifX family protein